MPADFAYEEPSTSALLIFSTYIWLLNLARWVVQRYTGAGLLGEIAIGMVFGSPLAEWLQIDWQDTMVIVGYIGLLAIVLEGGITTSLPLLVPLIPLSFAIAVTGVVVTFGLSFILIPAFSFAPLAAFATGSAMSSTSLGTTLAVLAGTKGIGFDLRQTKVGVALVGAAVADDVSAFVFSEIIKIVGEGTGGIGGKIGRTVGVTLGLGAVLVPLSIWVFKPLLTSQWTIKQLGKTGQLGPTVLVLFTAVGMVAAAGYAGTSPLYGIYVGGLILSYVSESATPYTSDPNIELEPLPRTATYTTTNTTGPLIDSPALAQTRSGASLNLHRAQTHPGTLGYHFASLPAPTRARSSAEPQNTDHALNFAGAYNAFLFPIVEYVLLPLFFGSIGYSIPFVRLWRGAIIWKGIIYSILMLIAKMACGLWMFWPSKSRGGMLAQEKGLPVTQNELKGEWEWKDRVPAVLFLGSAMVARGEIGLLISQIARHTNTPLITEDEFLIAIWAIVLNTIIGPLAVSITLKRFKLKVVAGGWE
ncbi:hypothetical protein IAR50_005832 [Cryptococcus sp. DSM 104548]